MTTFKNNAHYAEVPLTYLDLSRREDSPIKAETVLCVFQWQYKGGCLEQPEGSLRFSVPTSGDRYPQGLSTEIAAEWPNGTNARALRTLLSRRAVGGRQKARAVLAKYGTYSMLTSWYGEPSEGMPVIYSGMKAVYSLFGRVWDWAAGAKSNATWENMTLYMSEMVVAASASSRMDIPTAHARCQEAISMLESTRARALLQAVLQAKELIRLVNCGDARRAALREGKAQKELWEEESYVTGVEDQRIRDRGLETAHLRCRLGPVMLRVSQHVALLGSGKVRHVLGKSDVERLHQILMSSVSALVGVCAQAVVGTPKQKTKARRAVEVAEANIQRIVTSSRKVPLGEEVLVCKGYRRAYTAHLGRLAGPMCRGEFRGLVEEAKSTAPAGVLEIDEFLEDLATLDAASSLNAAKMFKICPAPDVSPGAAMIDRIKQIGNGNVMDPEMVPVFTEELKSQILRAYIRAKKGRMKLRPGVDVPLWWDAYLKGRNEEVPSSEIDAALAWEGDAKMPEVSAHDPGMWKDSGLGADTIAESASMTSLGLKRNMMTRLIFDESCPMPGRPVLSDEHVIKFFVKAEGHKDPARGIFSANLTDRQAQSWMERAVDKVACEHPSYMIGQQNDVKQQRVVQLTSMPKEYGWLPLYYSFDISGWSAKMPGQVQRISHAIWGELYDSDLFRSAHEINEGAHVYVCIDGYYGWYKNTASNFEGFNGKEMTMILVALLSLSVRVWRGRVVEAGVMSQDDANKTSALLFAYIDDGLSRIDLPYGVAVTAFNMYKATVIETFDRCGFSVEVTKCFPSERFSIFLNEVYLGGRHVVHGVRAAMAISAEPTERHTSLTERIDSVATGCRGAVMAGLAPLAGVMLMSFHAYMHLIEWCKETDPVILAGWSMCPRSWGGLGMPNSLQLYTSGSGAAFEESVATLQGYAACNSSIMVAYVKLCKTDLADRDPVGILTAPLSGRVSEGYMVDSRVAVAVRRALQALMEGGRLSSYATRLLRFADPEAFRAYAEVIVPVCETEVIQEQMLLNLAEAHPHSVFSAFARRLEKSTTVRAIVGFRTFSTMITENRNDARKSCDAFRDRFFG